MRKNISKTMFFAALCMLILVGLYLRMKFVLNIHFTNQYLGTEYWHDEYNYINMVKNLLANGTYGYWGGVDAYVTPGFPLFLAAIFKLFGTGSSGIFAAKVVQAILSSLSIFLCYTLSVKLTGKRAVGMIAAVLMAFYPPFMLYTRFLLTETLYIFLLLAYFNVQVVAFDKKCILMHIFSGVLFAIAVLVRPMIAILAPVFYIFIYIRQKEQRKETVRNFLFFAGAILIIMCPWWIRNLVTLHKFIPLASQGNPFYAGVIKNFESLPPAESNEILEGLQILWGEFIKDPVGTIKWFTYGKFHDLFLNFYYPMPDNVSYFPSLTQPLNLFIVFFGFVGTIFSLFWKKIRMYAIYLLIYVALSLMFIPTSRFSLQYIPLLCVFAGYLLHYISKGAYYNLKVECKNE